MADDGKKGLVDRLKEGLSSITSGLGNGLQVATATAGTAADIVLEPALSKMGNSMRSEGSSGTDPKRKAQRQLILESYGKDVG